MKKIKSLLAVSLALFLVLPANVFADVVGKISYVEGRVDKLDKKSNRYIPAVIADEISTKDVVRTKSYSKTEITFNDNSVVRLADSSQIKIEDYQIDDFGYRKKATINLERGRIRAIVSKTKDKTGFDIKTPNAYGSVKGSDIFMSYQKSATGILVADGTLRVLNPEFPDEVIDVRMGSASFVPFNASPQEPRIYLPIEKERYESDTGPSIVEIEGLLEDEEVTRARIMRIAGSVRIQPAGAASWHAPVLNEILNVGDKIVTGEDGRIEITIDNGHVLILKPDTQIILKSLKRDPKTGDYENEIECDYGRVIAKLRKIEGKSSFKAKTPTVTCGVRGTIMYLEVLSNLTKVFFEGGDGFVTSLLSGITKIINAGQTAAGDNEGNVSDPRDTTDEERENFGSGFGDEDGDTYGYSPSGGDAGGVLTGSAFIGGVPEPGAAGALPFNEVKPEFGEASGAGGTAETIPPPVRWSGSVDASYHYYDTESEVLVQDTPHNGFMSAVPTPFESPGTAVNIALDGEADPGDNISWWGHFKEDDTEDGSVIPDGMIAGRTASEGGLFFGLYIDINGDAGVVKGSFEGDYFEELDTWLALGSIYAQQRSSGYDPQDYILEDILEDSFIDGEAWGEFEDGGEIYLDDSIYEISFGALQSYTTWLVNPDSGNPESWGIFNIELGGYYEGPTSDNWRLFLAGDQWTGRGDDEYWIMTIEGDRWSGEIIEGKARGYFFRFTESGNHDLLNGNGDNEILTAGVIRGNALGDYEIEGEDTFQAIVLGEWVELVELETEIIGFDSEVMREFVSIPITEASSAILNGAGSFGAGGIISGSMEIDFFSNEIADLFALYVAGEYSGPTSDDFTLDLNNDDFSATITGTEWSDNEWMALVDGTGPDGIEFSGQADGIYTDVNPDTGIGTFEGVGAGTYEIGD